MVALGLHSPAPAAARVPFRLQLRPQGQGSHLRPDLAEPEFSSPIEPADLSSDLVYLRERSYALHRIRKFEEWFLGVADADGVVVDDELQAIIAKVEVALLAPITWPELYREPVEPTEELPETYEAFRHESQAAAYGMTVRRVKQRTKPKTSLPGCQGAGVNGGCQNLRAYGERFCPACRKKELARLRAAPAGR